MTDHVYKTVEITGTSTENIEAAVGVAMSKASESLHNLRWFEVTNIRGEIDAGAVSHWQVTVKLGFTLDDSPAD